MDCYMFVLEFKFLGYQIILNFIKISPLDIIIASGS